MGKLNALEITHLDLHSDSYSNEVKWISKVIPEPSVCYDLGANVGGFSLAMHKRWPNAKIYAYEPFTETYKKLQSNLLPHPIECFNIGFSDETKTNVAVGLPTISDEKTHNFGRITTEFNSDVLGEINLFSFGEYLKAAQHKPDFMKVDIEGHEFKVFSSAVEFNVLKDIPFLYVEINNHYNTKKSAQATKQLLSEYYDIIENPYTIAKNEWLLANRTKKSEFGTPSIPSGLKPKGISNTPINILYKLKSFK